MSNGIKTNSAEEIIDLTDLVSIGNGAGATDDTPKNEEDVLDSLVNDFENDKGGISGNEAAGTSDDEEEVLDLSNLDNLISSYNLDIDENRENNQDVDLDTNFDAILNDIKNDVENGGTEERTGMAEPNALQDNDLELKDSAVSEDFDTDGIPSLEDMDFPSLEKDEDEIDLLTKDIIDGTDRESANIVDNVAAQPRSADNGQTKNAFSEVLEEELDQSDVIDLSKEDEFSLEGLSQSSLGAETQESPQSKMQAKKVPSVRQNASSAADEEFKSDMAEEAEEIDDSEFGDILNELSLEHETDEEVVPFAHEASSDTMPIHLKGDISFLETPKNGQEHNEDINLVQSASKVLASDEAYLEKFDGEDDSVGARIKSLSTQMVSLEHRLIGSDSKWQDYGLELNYRISGLETKITELEAAIKEDFAEIRSEIGTVSPSVESNGQQQDSEALAQLADKIRAIETKIATLDDIFSEQKMLNDELAKNLDSLMESVGSASASSPESSELSEISGGIQLMEEKIAFLESELAGAQAKISDLEINIEKAASLAAAKVLREEIIPLLGK